MSVKRYLITGAAGFIGSSIARRLLAQEHEVWTIDNLSTGKKENLPAGIKFIEGMCQDPKSIEQLKETQFDAILHIAGQSSGEISFEDPVYDLRTNTEATLRLVQYGLDHACRRFIYASSMSVYGTVADAPIAEDRVCHPESFYGIGKLASEHYLRIYQSRGLRPTALRYFNVYGPHQNLDNLKQGMVSIYLAQLLFSEKIVVKGSLDRFRDFIYIDDVVDATLNAVENKNTIGKIYNVGTGQKTTVQKLLDKLIEISGIKKEIVLAGATPGDQQGIYADISLIKKDLGFSPKFSLDMGLARMIDWAKRKI